MRSGAEHGGTVSRAFDLVNGRERSGRQIKSERPGQQGGWRTKWAAEGMATGPWYQDPLYWKDIGPGGQARELPRPSGGGSCKLCDRFSPEGKPGASACLPTPEGRQLYPSNVEGSYIAGRRYSSIVAIG